MHMAAPSSPSDAPPAKQARVTPGFLSVPDTVHLSFLLPCLSRGERLAVSATAKVMVRLYGGQFETLALRLSLWDVNVATNLLLRQERLVELHVAGHTVAKAVATAITQGKGRTLRKLKLTFNVGQCWVRLAEEILTPLFVNPPDRFPALEELQMGWTWNQPSLEKFLRVLAQGAAPRLRTLVLGANPFRTERTLGLLVEALEARAAQGCAGLARLDLMALDWTRDGPADIQRRLWSALLPTLEYLPFQARDGQQVWPVVDAVLGQGAPCLRLLQLPDPRLARHVSRFARLESLTLQPLSRGVASSLIQAIHASEAPELFLPALRQLHVCLDDGDIGDLFFAALGQQGALPSLRELSINPTSKKHKVALDRQLGVAFGVGAFAGLESLSVGVYLTEQGLSAFVRGLKESPCRQTLRSLVLGHQPFDGIGLDEFLTVLAAGSFPALSRLVLPQSPLGDEWAEEFVSTAHLRAPLELLNLRMTGISNVGVIAIASALGSGKLGGKLRELELGERVEEGHITDAAALALATALEEGKKYVTRLEALYMEVPRLTRVGMEALVRAALANCPALKGIAFTSRGSSEADVEELNALSTGTDVLIMFKYPEEEAVDFEDEDEDEEEEEEGGAMEEDEDGDEMDV